MTSKAQPKLSRQILAARCHEIQTALRTTEVPEFEALSEIGMAVRIALHLRGLPNVKYQTLKLVAIHFLDIPGLAVERILRLLAEVGFVRLQTEGATIKAVPPTVPHYLKLYDRLGEYSEAARPFGEAEKLALTIVDRLAKAPANIDSLRNSLGA